MSSSNNRSEIIVSSKCGCYHCLAIFSPSSIKEWIKESGGGSSAVCPKCDADSVIGNGYGQEVTKAVLKSMHEESFSVDLSEYYELYDVEEDDEMTDREKEETKRFEKRMAQVAGFPEDILNAHKHSMIHYKEVSESSRCGCFYCTATFKPSEIRKCINEACGGKTALCPVCGIDSVIGDKSGYPITPEFLEEMGKYWFQTQASPYNPSAK